jgi:hypothetical protein
VAATRYAYTAVAPGRDPESFTSNVEYLPGDELPLRSARLTVVRVEEAGTEYSEGEVSIARVLHCRGK